MICPHCGKKHDHETWINVNAYLPPMFTDVYVGDENGNIYKARRWTGCTSGFDVEKDKLWEWLTPCDYHVEGVTHWKSIVAN